jgi:hypothetical protein
MSDVSQSNSRPDRNDPRAKEGPYLPKARDRCNDDEEGEAVFARGGLKSTIDEDQ